MNQRYPPRSSFFCGFLPYFRSNVLQEGVGIKFVGFIVIASIFSLFGCSHATFRILEKPVVFDEVRKELCIQYLEERYGMVKDFPSIEPRMIVIHWTAIPTLEASYQAMNPPVIPGARTAIASASTLNVAAHFLKFMTRLHKKLEGLGVRNSP